MSEEPGWVEILERPPLTVLDSTRPPDLVTEMQERLGALLDAHGCEPTLEGWRQLAVKFALKHEPALRITTPVEPHPGRGAKQKAERWGWRSAVRSAARRHGSNQAGAEYVHKNFADTPQVGTLKNLPGLAIPFPDEWRRYDYQAVAEAAAITAAAHLRAPEEEPQGRHD
jgi:hypothetical protein